MAAAAVGLAPIRVLLAAAEGLTQQGVGRQILQEAHTGSFYASLRRNFYVPALVSLRRKSGAK